MRVPVHSIETMGTVDGPGIRTVIFLQGCPLRCAYCHNPDSQCFYRPDTGESFNLTADQVSAPDLEAAAANDAGNRRGEHRSSAAMPPAAHVRVMDREEILRLIMRYKPYYRNGGGVTFSGGEPLMHGAFLAEILPRLKAEGIHCCIDTSGYGPEKDWALFLPYTDLVLLDLKQMDDWAYRHIAGASINGWQRFRAALMSDLYHGKIWLRHVMLPGWTDNEESMEQLWHFAEALLPKLEKIEILPYHRLGLEKYKQLGIPYRLERIPAMNVDRAHAFEEMLQARLEARQTQAADKTDPSSQAADQAIPERQPDGEKSAH